MNNYIDKEKAIALVERCASKADAITALKMMVPEDKQTEAKSFIITRMEQKDG